MKYPTSFHFHSQLARIQHNLIKDDILLSEQNNAVNSRKLERNFRNLNVKIQWLYNIIRTLAHFFVIQYRHF